MSNNSYSIFVVLLLMMLTGLLNSISGVAADNATATATVTATESSGTDRSCYSCVDGGNPDADPDCASTLGDLVTCEEEYACYQDTYIDGKKKGKVFKRDCMEEEGLEEGCEETMAGGHKVKRCKCKPDKCNGDEDSVGDTHVQQGDSHSNGMVSGHRLQSLLLISASVFTALSLISVI